MHGDDRRARQHAALFVGDRSGDRAGPLGERRVRWQEDEDEQKRQDQSPDVASRRVASGGLANRGVVSQSAVTLSANCNVAVATA